VTALAGMPSVDAKLAGRNHVEWGEIPILVWVLGPIAWLAPVVLHPWLFGVPVF
jgi:hypothetical protein